MSFAALCEAHAEADTASSEAPFENTPAAPETKEPLRHDFRPLANFGIFVGIQTLGVGIASLFTGLSYHFSDRSLIAGFGVMLAVTPAIDGTVGWVVGKSSSIYSSPIGAMMLASYIGAGAAYASAYLNIQRDDPEVDGKYDAIYFDHQEGGGIALNVLAFGFGPVLLPALGCALGHLLMRRPLEKNRKVAFAPPAPFAYRSGRENGEKTFGVQVIRMSF